MSEIKNKIYEYFEDMIVYKNLRKNNFFKTVNLPSFLRDWILKRFADDNGNIDVDEVSEYIKRVLPQKEEWVSIKDRIVMENERVKILAKINVDINISKSEITFSLPDYNLKNKETIIEPRVWDRCKEHLLSSKDIWGVVELGYRPFVSNAEPGKIKLLGFQSFCPYQIDIDYFKDARSYFTIDEWINVVLGAIDYNAAGYESENEKLTVLTRLLPFIEKRINLIELAPKGTAKSYMFGQISKNGWLSSGGIMSRAKMFFDMQKRSDGLVCTNDFVALDEIQTITFSNTSEMRAALKGYLESGKFTVGNKEGSGDAGVILLGNIKHESMDINIDMFGELPEVFHESALIDRFHGFIKGWDIPRMHEDLKMDGWALNSEYFSEIMHILREDVSYRGIVDELVIVPFGSDTRDTEAVKRICTAYLKMLFPHVRCVEDVNIIDFKKYCLNPAIGMRSIIKNQLAIIDIEYRGKGVPYYKVVEGA